MITNYWSLSNHSFTVSTIMLNVSIVCHIYLTFSDHVNDAGKIEWFHTLTIFLFAPHISPPYSTIKLEMLLSTPMLLLLTNHNYHSVSSRRKRFRTHAASWHCGALDKTMPWKNPCSVSYQIGGKGGWHGMNQVTEYEVLYFFTEGSELPKSDRHQGALYCQC